MHENESDDDRAVEAYRLARALLGGGDLEGAIAHLEVSAAADPHFKTLELLGEAWLRLGKPDRAVEPLAIAATLNRQVRAPSLLAQALLESGDVARAQDTARIALERHPNNKVARRVLERIPAESRKRVLKRTYTDLIEQVPGVIAEADPMELLAGGAPPDEYEPEVRALIPKLDQAPDLVSLERVVTELFTNAFGQSCAGDHQRLRTVSQHLWSLMSARRSGRLTSG
jgi:tetratricopeptide (TPR) repeat protein